MSKFVGHKVIGEGSYGCVHKPSLKCSKDKKQSYEGKVSKLMKKKYAEEELKENELISKIDKEREYSLGKPHDCKVAVTKSNADAIEQCDDFEKKHIRDYKLLIMNDGGSNLKQFAKKMEGEGNNSSNKSKMELFWIESSRLFYGLSKFCEYDIVHYDLKPQNIVYNDETNRVNFIDFGFLKKKDVVKADMNLSKHRQALWYWYYPFENMFLNRNEFVNFVNKSQKQRSEFIKELVNKVDTNDDMNHFYEFYDYVGSKNEKTNNAAFMKVAKSFKMNDYDRIVEQSVDNVDSYGVGISLYYVLRKTKHLIDSSLSDELEKVFQNMITALMNNRDNVNVLMRNYEKVLKSSGLLKKYNYKFQDHMIQKQADPTPFQSISKGIKRMLGYESRSSSSESSSPKNITKKRNIGNSKGRNTRRKVSKQSSYSESTNDSDSMSTNDSDSMSVNDSDSISTNDSMYLSEGTSTSLKSESTINSQSSRK